MWQIAAMFGVILMLEIALLVGCISTVDMQSTVVLSLLIGFEFGVAIMLFGAIHIASKPNREYRNWKDDK